ncbi:MAG: DEAD/DEAH box helicase family protein [Bacillaceae bacterium]|nr:DEAD/DEAH box helicase family protein [Bacillaceae bacterium]
MNVRIYRIIESRQGNSHQSFFVTPHPPLDFTYWQLKGIRQCGLFARSLSVGQAFERIRQLSEQWDLMQTRELNQESAKWSGRSETGSVQFVSLPEFPSSFSPHHLDHLLQESFSFLPLIAGRALLWHEVHTIAAGYRSKEWADQNLSHLMQLLYLEGKLHVSGAVEKRGPEKGRRFQRLISRIQRDTGASSGYICHRCGETGSGAIRVSYCAGCGQDCAYCESCIQMGRSRQCTPLYLIPETGAVTDRESCKACALPEGLQLTPQQQKASDQAVAMLTDDSSDSPTPTPLPPRKLLIWAVCGAGKTEVMFPVMAEALGRGLKVLVAIPRRDVVSELVPRFREAFPDVTMAELHGNSREKWTRAALTVATTHQLLRFYQNFDLVIVDEVDAFPYHNNPLLYRAVDRAQRPGARVIYLSATPPRSLLRSLRQQEGSIVRIPARYHGHPLPVPEIKIRPDLDRRIRNERNMPVLREFLHHVAEEERQAFLFVPYIEEAEKMRRYIASCFPAFREGVCEVHSRHPERAKIVEQFREGMVRVLVTTTIMERGVTVPRTDVIVWRADATVFDEASLVQIAGRAGRSARFPEGRVWFVAEQRTRGQVAAVRHIRQMNRLASQQGLLKGEGD